MEIKMKMRVFFTLLFALAGMSVSLYAKLPDKYIEISSRENTAILENIRAITCDGDTAAYKNLMLQIPYYDFFVYSVYMASKYNYAPAYYNAFRIYDRWLNLYDTQIDTISWKNLRFWLQWGVEAGSSACEKILCDSILTDEYTYSALDSLNSFVFVIPQNNDSSDSIRATLPGEKKVSISKEQLEKYKMQRLCNNDSAIRILETYAYGSDFTLKKYTMNNTDVFPINENFMFRVYRHLKDGDCSYITFSILWHLSHTYRLCDNTYSSTFENKLGVYLLHLGYEAGDRYCILPLAELYTKGIYVPQDTVRAKKILMTLMKNEKNAEHYIRRWSNER